MDADKSSKLSFSVEPNGHTRKWTHTQRAHSQMHACTHTCTHAFTHARIGTNTHTNTYGCSNVQMHGCVHTCKPVYTIHQHTSKRRDTVKSDELLHCFC